MYIYFVYIHLYICIYINFVWGECPHEKTNKKNFEYIFFLPKKNSTFLFFSKNVQIYMKDAEWAPNGPYPR